MEPEHGAVRTPDGRDLTTYTWGNGDDLVIFEAGLGASGRCWAPVIHLLPSNARAVAYDRAGYGTSTSDPSDRTLDALTADFISVVQAQGAQRVVLVGHSWGAPIVRRAAELLPAGRVHSLVLVDPTDEQANAYFTRGARTMERIQALTLPLLARTGILKTSLRKTFERFLPSNDLDATILASGCRSAVSASVSENRQIRAGLQQLREASTPGSVPAVVI